MENYRRTGPGSLLQTCSLMGLPLPNIAYTTLNEKLSINAAAALGANENPKMRYLCIGIGAAQGRTGVNGLTLVGTAQHKSRDNGMFQIFPFAVRPLDSDLTATERARFGLRRVESIGGVNYAVYYLRRLDLTNVVPKMQLLTITNNVPVYSDFSPVAEDLSPTPPVISNTGSQTTDGQYLVVTAPLDVVFSAWDAVELLNAATILYGSEDYALISEMGLCSGVDRDMTINDPNSTNFVMSEVIKASIVTHVSTLQPLKGARTGFSLRLDVGATEPMFQLA